MVIPAEQLERYLSEALGESITLPRDDRPMRSPRGNWPLYYAVAFYEHDYYVSCFLMRPTEHTRSLGPGLNKYEVGSRAIPERRTRRFLDIPEEERTPTVGGDGD